jgi:hypothetical protein
MALCPNLLHCGGLLHRVQESRAVTHFGGCSDTCLVAVAQTSVDLAAYPGRSRRRRDGRQVGGVPRPVRYFSTKFGAATLLRPDDG